MHEAQHVVISDPLFLLAVLCDLHLLCSSGSSERKAHRVQSVDSRLNYRESMPIRGFVAGVLRGKVGREKAPLFCVAEACLVSQRLAATWRVIHTQTGRWQA